MRYRSLPNINEGYYYVMQYKRQSHSCYKDREKMCGQMQAARTGKRAMTEKDVVKVGKDLSAHRLGTNYHCLVLIFWRK